jgi:hypothetical protein
MAMKFGQLSDKELIDTLRYNSHIIISQHVVKWAIDFYIRNQCLTQVHRDNVIKVLYGSGSILPPSLKRNVGGYIVSNPSSATIPPAPQVVTPAPAPVPTPVTFTPAEKELIERMYIYFNRRVKTQVSRSVFLTEVTNSKAAKALIKLYVQDRKSRRKKMGKFPMACLKDDTKGFTSSNVEFISGSVFNERISAKTGNWKRAQEVRLGSVPNPVTPVALPTKPIVKVQVTGTKTWVTAEEAGQYFKVDPKRIYDTKLEHKFGRDSRFVLEELEAYFLSR